MNKHIVKRGRRILGFVGKNGRDLFYAFGKPSQSSYMAFYCSSVDEGIQKIKDCSNISF